MKAFIGEIIGTFILVFFGLGSVAISVLFGALDLFGVAMFWGLAVTFGIYASNQFSKSHLNPAVSTAFLVIKQINFREYLHYVSGQFIGGFIAAGLIYFLYNPFIIEFEMAHHIVRGSQESVHSAMIFGEYFPNPAITTSLPLSEVRALIFELIGTGILMFSILSLTTKGNYNKWTPLAIGLTVTILICLIAPATQAGFNPARDFAPRLFSFFMGWQDVAFHQGTAFFTVYILGPVLGATIAAIFYKILGKVK